MNRSLRMIRAPLACAAALLLLPGASRPQAPAAPASAPAASLAAGAAGADPQFLEQYTATLRFTLGTPQAIQVVPGGRAVLFLRSGPRSFVRNLYELDPQTGAERVLASAEQLLGGREERLSAEERARRERARLTARGVAAFDFPDDGARVLVPLSGRLFVIERSTGTVRELPADGGDPLDPRFSPDGARVACVRKGDLYAIDLATGSQRRLTTGATPALSHGLAEFVAQEELTTLGPLAFNAAIIRPRALQAGRRYPVLVSVYAGPHVQTVRRDPWGAYLLDQWIADHGFVVLTLDGRGTPGRGRAWERAIKGNLIDVQLADQVAGLQAAGARYPELDLARAGIFGWSFGGYFSAMAAMRRPDVYRAAVAGAPVCDWRDYDTHYTERYLGLPQANPDGYRRSAVETWCPDLRVPLLVIHGTADDNVYFMHSLKLTDALFRAGRPYDFVVLPGFTHMVPDAAVQRALQERILAFFAAHLGPGG